MMCEFPEGLLACQHSSVNIQMHTYDMFSCHILNECHQSDDFFISNCTYGFDMGDVRMDFA